MAETKSRYEVISELEDRKRKLIMERDGFPDIIRRKKKAIRDLKRELEDMEEDVSEYEASVDERKQTINDLIESIDTSLKKFEMK